MSEVSGSVVAGDTGCNGELQLGAGDGALKQGRRRGGGGGRFARVLRSEEEDVGWR